MAIKYLKTAIKTPSTDDSKTRTAQLLAESPKIIEAVYYRNFNQPNLDKFFIDLIVSVFYLLTKGVKHSLAIFTGYISFYKRLNHLIGLRKNLNRKIKHYSTYSIIFYFIGLKRLKKV